MPDSTASKPTIQCDFCGAPYAPDRPLIAGQNGHICEQCVSLSARVVQGWGRRREAREWMPHAPKPREIKALLDEYVIGQDAAKEVLAVAVYNHYKRLKVESSPDNTAIGGDTESPADGLAGGLRIEKSNVLMPGPSGTGKTLLARTLARIVGVPFAITDATTLTQAGYVGDDVETMLLRLLDTADGHVGKAEWGIVYIDEIDKLSRKSEGPSVSRDVSGEGVQQALLKLVEGSEVSLKVSGRRDAQQITLDTRNILFLAGGAFEGLDTRVLKRMRPGPSGIGFHASHDMGEDPDTAQLLLHTEPEDLRGFGLIPELIGRFPVIAPLAALDEDALISILTEPRNALLKQYQALLAQDDVSLDITEDGLQAIAKLAIERGTGARGLRGIVERVLHRTLFEVPSREDVQRCVVDAQAVANPERVRWESEDEEQIVNA
ncbi:MAG: ATP-dependent Clp protease ATP-binding subunit ClpX [Gammaproteobacteria bacterium]